jgi:multidrug efflux pump subunit AcrB
VTRLREPNPKHQSGSGIVRSLTLADGAFSAFSSSGWSFGAPQLTRLTACRLYEIIVAMRPVSSGTAMDLTSRPRCARCRRGVGYWPDAPQERLSDSQAPLLCAVSILFVFLVCLAALYESWSIR